MSQISVDSVIPQSGTNITIGGSGDTVTLGSGASASGFGKVLQVVQAVKTDSFTTSSATYVDVTGLSVSITPSSTSNKVLVFATLMFNMGGSGTDRVVGYNLTRESTSIFSSVWRTYDYGTSGVYVAIASPISYLDSPSSTSALTYKIQIAKNAGANDAGVNTESGSSSSIIAMEIAG
jgi:hypothetical protein